MGEGCIRGNVSHGDGVYKSVDAGRTWKNVGLRDSRQIGRVRIDPRDPDVVYVAALGHTFGPNHERGVFRTRDGGQSWKCVLFVNDSTGAVDLGLDPKNPRILYATTWQVYRTPWSLESGGAGSGLWKSVDGGDTWKRLTGEGLPKGLWGRIGVTVSPVNSDRVWAAIEADDATVFPAPRPAFLRTWIGAPGHAGCAVVRDGRPAGWGVIRPCRRGFKIGPLVADDRATAEAVLSALLAKAGGGEIFLDVPGINRDAVALAQDFGLAPVFETARMYTGAIPPLRLQRVFGVTSFELG